MSDKKRTHEYRVDTYLNPCDFRVLKAYSKFTGDSKSSIVNLAVVEFIKKIPPEQKAIMLQVAKEE